MFLRQDFFGELSQQVFQALDDSRVYCFSQSGHSATGKM
jgi:hypothetical protein